MKNITLRVGAICMFIISLPSVAKPIIKHTLGSGQNVYRVEIRNMDRFKVLETGDTDGVGELRELEVQLTSFSRGGGESNQYDGFSKISPFLYNTHTNKAGGSGNLEIKVGDLVKLAGHRSPAGSTQLWTHVYSNPADSPHSSNYTGRVELRVQATELDCTGQRVCKRNSQGSVTVSFKIPEFTTPPPTVCTRTNTFLLEPLDDQLHIRGIEGTSVYTNTRKADVNDPFWLLLKHKKGGPRLMPYNAEICIASTVAPTNANLKKNIDRIKGTTTKDQRNKKIQQSFR